MNRCPRCKNLLRRVPAMPGDRGGPYEWNCLNCGHYIYPGQPQPAPTIETPRCKNGHELTDENLRMRTRGDGSLYKGCLSCERNRKRRAASAHTRPTPAQKLAHHGVISAPYDDVKLRRETTRP